MANKRAIAYRRRARERLAIIIKGEQHMKKYYYYLTILLIFATSCNTLFETEDNNATNKIIKNYSFESNTDWENLTRSDNGYYSPVDGNYVAYQNGDSNWISQQTDVLIEAGKLYELTLYARSVNAANNGALTELYAGLFANDTEITTVLKSMNVQALSGAPETTPNDDGANVWLDGDYRMQFSDFPMHQTISADPINDPWNLSEDDDYDADMAMGQIITPNGKKFVYSTIYQDFEPFYSQIWLREATGSPPDYDWNNWELILEHHGDQEPWIIDAHIFFDQKTGRMWMSWGGHKLWITELDPNTGKVIGNPDDPEFDTHPAGTHTLIAEFLEGDEWSNGIGYMEGPAVYKYEDYYYYFGTYGDLSESYTIRLGRSLNPQGPYLDRNGVDLLNDGGTLILGNEANQLVPGHPHIWQENGQHYLGYDYRTDLNQQPQDEFDIMGIRKIYWESGWPTVYQPVTLTFSADDYPNLIGEQLVIRFKNSGDAESELAVDCVSLRMFQ